MSNSTHEVITSGFPAPWIAGGFVAHHEFRPIDNAEYLASFDAEGGNLGTLYAECVAEGFHYLYAVYLDGKLRVLIRLDQGRYWGDCRSIRVGRLWAAGTDSLSNSAELAIYQWLRSRTIHGSDAVEHNGVISINVPTPGFQLVGDEWHVRRAS